MFPTSPPAPSAPSSRRPRPCPRNDLSPQDLILPLFVRPGRGIKKEIASMPGNFQLSVDRLVEEVGAAVDLGVHAFILFGIPAAQGRRRLQRLRRRRHRPAGPARAAAGLQGRAAHHRRMLLRIHRSRPLRRARANTAAGSTSTTTRRCRCWPSNASATPGPGPTWSLPAA